MPNKQKLTDSAYQLGAELSDEDVAQVRKCLRALAPIMESGMTVHARSELAAVLLASAAKTAQESAVANGQPKRADDLRFVFEALAIERSRQLYTQGRV